MIKINKHMDVEKIRKFLSKKGYRLIKKKSFSHKLKYKSIYTTSLLSLIVIIFFYILPLSANKISSLFKATYFSLVVCSLFGLKLSK